MREVPSTLPAIEHRLVQTLDLLKELQTDGKLVASLTAVTATFAMLTKACATVNDLADYGFESAATAEAALVVFDKELVERMARFNDQAHDMASLAGFSCVVNHLLARGLDVAEHERDEQTAELF